MDKLWLENNLDLKFPKIWPKSIWKNIPFSFIIIFPGCLSPIPITQVATQYPANDLIKLSNFVSNEDVCFPFFLNYLTINSLSNTPATPSSAWSLSNSIPTKHSINPAFNSVGHTLYGNNLNRDYFLTIIYPLY